MKLITNVPAQKHTDVQFTQNCAHTWLRFHIVMNETRVFHLLFHFIFLIEHKKRTDSPVKKMYRPKWLWNLPFVLMPSFFFLLSWIDDKREAASEACLSLRVSWKGSRRKGRQRYAAADGGREGPPADRPQHHRQELQQEDLQPPQVIPLHRRDAVEIKSHGLSFSLVDRDGELSKAFLFQIDIK